MATPRVKRALAGQATDPAQRSITSFFARDENAASPFERSSRSPSLSHEISSPLLPPSVQANLLAVGMRVRKSVPEGYKTGKETNERSTPSHYQPQPKAPSTYNTYLNTYAKSNAQTASYKSFLQSAGRPAETQTAPRELLPFCGLNKIGGMGVQSYGHDDRPMFAASLFGGMDDDATVVVGDMEPPSLTSSQETVSSMASTQMVYAAKKRFLGDDEDINVHDDTKFQSRAVPFSTSSSINAWLQDGPVSPRTQAPVLHMGRRVLAVPRRRQQNRSPSVSVPPATSESPKLADGQLPSSGANVRVYDQENAGDFDEADFLDDMEMSGM